jgi:hypothetical protein
MGNGKNDYMDIISETGNWNVAKQYSLLKIMKPLALADDYETMALFGSSSLVDELQIQIGKEELRIKGFERLVSSLILLIDNSLFAIKIKSDTEKLKKYRKDLEQIKGITSTLYFIRKNQINKTKEIKINEEKFIKVLDIVSRIKSEINTPLNHSHLIFTDKEEFDPKKLKSQIKEGAETRG